jgi:hypothetical protein
VAVTSEQLAIESYIMDVVIAGVTIPSQVKMFTKLEGFREMPKFKTLGTRVVAVVDGPVTDHETRKTSPRSEGGDKAIIFTVPITLHGGVGSDEQGGGDQWKVLCAAVRQAFRDANTGLYITDPITGGEVWLHSFGESMVGRAMPPKRVGEGEATAVKFEYNLAVEVIVWIQD